MIIEYMYGVLLVMIEAVVTPLSPDRLLISCIPDNPNLLKMQHLIAIIIPLYRVVFTRKSIHVRLSLVLLRMYFALCILATLLYPLELRPAGRGRGRASPTAITVGHARTRVYILRDGSGHV